MKHRKYKWRNKGLIRFCDKDSDISNSIILDDYVILNEEIWEKSRYCFSHYQHALQEHVLLPVLNKAGQLICFAYEDADANREIRMLRELILNPTALQFTDVYPEYDCVKIYDFNELAYFFVKYLINIGVKVEVIGEWWRLFSEVEYKVPNYGCLIIYAEGTVPKTKNWIENLLRSVSVEFECIDIIYESNLKKGIIRDVYEDADKLLDHLRDENEIIIYGTGREEQAAYDFLFSIGIDICCFVDPNGESPHRMFGKDILSDAEARNKYKNAIFIECSSKNSALGSGKIDYYDYIGYRRNERFFLLKDYVDIPESNLINVLGSTKVSLIGNYSLCYRLYDYFRQQGISVVGIIDIDKKECRKSELSEILAKDIDDNMNTMCLIVLPEQFKGYWKRKQKEKRRQIETYLKEIGLCNYSDYFSYMLSFINIETVNEVKYSKEYIIPKRIVLGSIAGSCGNIFFRGILDGHPSVMMMDYDYSADSFLDTLHDNLFWVCVRLSMVEADDILPLFWDMYETEYVKENVRYIYNRLAFDEKMKQLLSCGKRFTSQELFVMFHVSFMYMYGREINVTDIKNMVIYWEPHSIDRPVLEKCVKWFGEGKGICNIFNLVRDSCIRNGSNIKFMIEAGAVLSPQIACEYVLEDGFNGKDYAQNERLVVKFESLKCNPKDTLMEIFNRWGIAWSESCMTTTSHGEKVLYDNGERKVSDFDIGPVYDNHDKYLSKFDQFRIMIATQPWQSMYGYTYMSIKDFSQKELQEMFLKPFRFEKLIEYKMSDIDYKIEAQKFIWNKLRQVRIWDIFKENSNWNKLRDS